MSNYTSRTGQKIKEWFGIQVIIDPQLKNKRLIHKETVINFSNISALFLQIHGSVKLQRNYLKRNLCVENLLELVLSKENELNKNYSEQQSFLKLDLSMIIISQKLKNQKSRNLICVKKNNLRILDYQKNQKNSKLVVQL